MLANAFWYPEPQVRTVSPLTVAQSAGNTTASFERQYETSKISSLILESRATRRNPAVL